MLPPPLPAPIFGSSPRASVLGTSERSLSPSAEVAVSDQDEEIEVIDHPPYLKRTRDTTGLPPAKAPKGATAKDTSVVHHSDPRPDTHTVAVSPSTVRPAEKTRGKGKGKEKVPISHQSPAKPVTHATPKTNRKSLLIAFNFI